MKTPKAYYRLFCQVEKLKVITPYLIILIMFLLGSYVIADIAIKTREVVLW
mgnify:CR=1 FL=1